MDYNKLILVEQFFRWNGNDFKKDASFVITERIEKINNLKLTIKQQQQKNEWIKRLQTQALFGFNRELEIKLASLSNSHTTK